MFESKGWLRTLGATLSALGGIAFTIPIPIVQAWSPVLLAIGSVLGGVGVVRAAASGTLTNMKANE